MLKRFRKWRAERALEAALPPDRRLFDDPIAGPDVGHRFAEVAKHLENWNTPAIA